jgi:hypothetical protein
MADWSGPLCENLNTIKCEFTKFVGYKDSCETDKFGYLKDYDGSPPCNIIEGDELLLVRLYV